MKLLYYIENPINKQLRYVNFKILIDTQRSLKKVCVFWCNQWNSAIFIMFFSFLVIVLCPCNRWIYNDITAKPNKTGGEQQPLYVIYRQHTFGFRITWKYQLSTVMWSL